MKGNGRELKREGRGLKGKGRDAMRVERYNELKGITIRSRLEEVAGRGSMEMCVMSVVMKDTVVADMTLCPSL